MRFFFEQVLVSNVKKRVFLTTKVFSSKIHVSKLLLSIKKIRNVGIIAHIDAGKTTTTERILYYGGRTNSIGEVDDGSTVTDFLEVEKQRGITVQSAAVSLNWDDHKINIIDTPGHSDFSFEVIKSLRVLDNAIFVLDAVKGVEAQTERNWHFCESTDISKMIYINKMDREGSDFFQVIREIILKFGIKLLICNIPFFMESHDYRSIFKGVIDIVHMKILVWDLESNIDGTKIEVIDLLSQKNEYHKQYVQLEKFRKILIETLSEFDEVLVDVFLKNNCDYLKVSEDELKKSIRRIVVNNQAVCVFVGSSFKNIGVQPLLDGITTYLSSPLEKKLPSVQFSDSNLSKNFVVEKNNLEIQCQMDEKKGLIFHNDPSFTVVFIFKVVYDSIKGFLAFFRTYSGTFTSNIFFVNTRTKKKLSPKTLFLIHGNTFEKTKNVCFGNIGVFFAGDSDIVTGDTLVSKGVFNKPLSTIEANTTLNPISNPETLFKSAIEPFSSGDQKHLIDSLSIVCREDPSLSFYVDNELNQIIINGMGELQLEIVRDKLIKDMKVKARLTKVSVSYKESMVKSNTIISKQKNEEGTIMIQFKIEKNNNSHDFTKKKNVYLSNEDNNVIIFEKNSTSELFNEAIQDSKWKLKYTLKEIEIAMVNGFLTSFHVGGPNFGLSLHSLILTVIKWDFPVNSKAYEVSDLLKFARKSVLNYFETYKSFFGVMEPIILISISTNSESVGDVCHDLVSKRQAIITSIMNEKSNDATNNDIIINDLHHAYFASNNDTVNLKIVTENFQKKIINAEISLRQIIGYLPVLKSLTKGHGTFNTKYIGMKKVSEKTYNYISEEFNLN